MKVVITGANGLLGQHLVKLLLKKGFTVIATGRGQSRLLLRETHSYHYYDADIADHAKLAGIMAQEKPGAVIHAAAMTQVDDCELNQDKCFETNVSGTSCVLSNAEAYSRHIIFISTDFVFSGEKGNYGEDDERNPVSRYGAAKVQAEELLKASRIPWTIVRTCLVYGNTIHGTRNNIINWVKDKLERKERIKVVDDQIRTPTYVEDLAAGIALILERKATGIFHISGKDILTPFEMAIRTADYFGLDKTLIERVNASSFTQPARRPPKTGLIIDKARRELGYEPLGFDEGLRKMFGT